MLFCSMIDLVYKYKKIVFLIGMVSLIIPLFYITYVVITSEGDSVAFTIGVDSVMGYILFVYYIILISLLVGYIVYWLIKHIRHLLTLKNEKKKTELMHLQSQVNPHFFFNMLNNLYGLIDKDTDKAKKLVLKLSNMMRYSIYEGQNNTVHLKEEVDFISNYIELHKMRYRKSIDITFTKEIENENLKVLPLLFIILVENAFKHGVEVLREKAYVHIVIKTKGKKLYFEVVNNFDEENNTEIGIGLANLKKRLELVYPKKHHLSNTVYNDVFESILEIQL